MDEYDIFMDGEKTVPCKNIPIPRFPGTYDCNYSIGKFVLALIQNT